RTARSIRRNGVIGCRVLRSGGRPRPGPGDRDLFGTEGFEGVGARGSGSGIAAGLPAAVFLTPLMAGLLYGVSPRDPLTVRSVALLLPLTGAAACAIPASRRRPGSPLRIPTRRRSRRRGTGDRRRPRRA